jgi:AraC family transcriptional activator FtrA
MKKPKFKENGGRLVLVAYDDLRTFEYAIAAEVFALQRPNLGVTWYQTSVVSPDKGPLRGYGGIVIKPDAPLSMIETADTIVLPGWRDTSERPPEVLLNALRAAAKRKATLFAICSGSFILAAAGLLDGKRATTHWLFADDFKRQFPNVTFEDDVLYCDEGNIITSAGSGAGVDASLHLVRRDFGPRVANMVARRMVVAPHREGGQAQYVEAPVSVRPGPTIGEVLDWARARLDQPLTIGNLVKRTALSGRTFLRQFHDAVGMAPNAWLQRERIARARDLLESTALAHSDIADQCGYDSPETFRIAFRRIVGVSPGAYRTRFSRATA